MDFTLKINIGILIVILGSLLHAGIVASEMTSINSTINKVPPTREEILYSGNSHEPQECLTFSTISTSLNHLIDLIYQALNILKPQLGLTLSPDLADSEHKRKKSDRQEMPVDLSPETDDSKLKSLPAATNYKQFIWKHHDRTGYALTQCPHPSFLRKHWCQHCTNEKPQEILLFAMYARNQEPNILETTVLVGNPIPFGFEKNSPSYIYTGPGPVGSCTKYCLSGQTSVHQCYLDRNHRRCHYVGECQVFTHSGSGHLFTHREPPPTPTICWRFGWRENSNFHMDIKEADLPYDITPSGRRVAPSPTKRLQQPPNSKHLQMIAPGTLVPKEEIIRDIPDEFQEDSVPHTNKEAE